MSRLIKFRAWDVQESCFADISKLGICDDGSVWYVQAIDENEKDIDPPFFPGNTDDVILMQYTVLKDKNGIEIYEGDITDDHIGIGVVEYNHSGYRVNYNNGQCKWLFDYLVSEYRTIEVIGNIYEHPHLLEGS